MCYFFRLQYYPECNAKNIITVSSMYDCGQQNWQQTTKNATGISMKISPICSLKI